MTSRTNAPRLASATRAAIAIFLLAFMLRAALAVIVTTSPSSFDEHILGGDFERYHSIATSLLRGEGFSEGRGPTAISAPLYPLWLAGAYWAGGITPAPILLAQLLQAIVGAATAVVLYAAARSFLPERAARAAGIILAVYPHHIILSVQLLTETLFLFFLALFLWAWISCVIKPTPLSAVLTGGAFSAAVLTRPVIVLFLPFALGFIIAKNDERAARMRCCALIFLISATLILPWSIRNSLAFGSFVPLSTWGGHALYQGNAPNGTGGQGGDILLWRDYAPIDFAAAYPNITLNEAERDTAYKNAAIKNILAHPFGFLMRAPAKLRNMLRINYEGASLKNGIVTTMSYVPVLLAGTLGMWLLRRHLQTLCLSAFLMYYLAFHAIFFGIIRYRIVIEMVLAVFAAYAVHRAVASLTRPHENSGRTPANAP